MKKFIENFNEAELFDKDLAKSVKRCSEFENVRIIFNTFSVNFSSNNKVKCEDAIMAIAIVDSQLTIIQPSGHINAANASEFQNQLTSAVTATQQPVLVDMNRVESLDSAALMSLITAFRLAQSLDRRFGICSVPATVRIIFELTQLDKAFEIFDSRDDFTASLDSSKEALRLTA